MTETSPTVLISRLEDSKRKAGTAGMLLPTIEVRLVTTETADGDAAEDAAPGEPGELWLRGGSIMKARVYTRAFLLAD